MIPKIFKSTVWDSAHPTKGQRLPNIRYWKVFKGHLKWKVAIQRNISLLNILLI